MSRMIARIYYVAMLAWLCFVATATEIDDLDLDEPAIGSDATKVQKLAKRLKKLTEDQSYAGFGQTPFTIRHINQFNSSVDQIVNLGIALYQYGDVDIDPKDLELDAETFTNVDAAIEKTASMADDAYYFYSNIQAMQIRAGMVTTISDDCLSKLKEAQDFIITVSY